jgi:hypothetical protein
MVESNNDDVEPKVRLMLIIWYYERNI